MSAGVPMPHPRFNIFMNDNYYFPSPHPHVYWGYDATQTSPS